MSSAVGRAVLRSEADATSKKMEEIHKDNGMLPAEAEKLGALTPGDVVLVTDTKAITIEIKQKMGKTITQV